MRYFPRIILSLVVLGLAMVIMNSVSNQPVKGAVSVQGEHRVLVDVEDLTQTLGELQLLRNQVWLRLGEAWKAPNINGAWSAFNEADFLLADAWIAVSDKDWREVKKLTNQIKVLYQQAIEYADTPERVRVELNG